MIETKHLRLIPVDRAFRAAFQQGKPALAAHLGVTIPEQWPHFPEAIPPLTDDEPAESSPPSEWEGYYFIDPGKGILVGDGGFKGGPDAEGTVEIGYEIATEFWNRGYATEAARGMIDFAFSHPEVTAVLAHTLAEKNASNAVLQKLGMTYDGEIVDPDDGPIWRWRIDRATYEAAEKA